MMDTFFQFITDTTKENFMSSQQIVFKNNGYNPYSKDIDTIKDLLDKSCFQEAIDFDNINTLLSPRAHLYKHFALKKMGKEKNAQAELILAQKIMESISLTGDGSKEHPYIVTRISDERDMLMYFEESFGSQKLSHNQDRSFDIISCKSGKDIWFDITTPYSAMKAKLNKGIAEKKTVQNQKSNNMSSVKKWWEFWK